MFLLASSNPNLQYSWSLLSRSSSPGSYDVIFSSRIMFNIIFRKLFLRVM